MFDNLVVELGPWSWWLVGLILLAAELILPGFFLVWIGLAGIIVGALSLLFWDSAFWVWQLQGLVFAATAVIVTLIGRHYLYNNSQATDEPFLNQRSASLVGRTATLDQPITEGRGRIRLNDTYWTVNGPDLPVGTRVKVVASSGRDLTVEPV
ncbi:NfeD family protein [Rhizobium sp. LEGMi198b]|uniref:NfeD family protein n=1 Tax=unclassified Rhizobium TaxID=2613769 RepID=UPI000CDF3DD8|nr:MULTISPECIES: NfeD family protein [Rhizobium]AVA22875.1 nodulation efficiency NfeD-like protein [Rhizobium sp. NXC24]UWU20251.1 NfeD family protein [Rhizobium tropici]WFU01070.1 NfeD family protein [Rhizobium sp. CB3171]